MHATPPRSFQPLLQMFPLLCPVAIDAEHMRLGLGCIPTPHSFLACMYLPICEAICMAYCCTSSVCESFLRFQRRPSHTRLSFERAVSLGHAIAESQKRSPSVWHCLPAQRTCPSKPAWPLCEALNGPGRCQGSPRLQSRLLRDEEHLLSSEVGAQ